MRSLEFFDHAERHALALFPCAQGTKRPILKWKAGSTHNRAQWATWQSEHNNLAIDCAKSGIIAVDVDASKVTREEAWGAYCALCLSWGLPDPATPMTQSARGGWHIPFKRPAHLAATDLRGGGTLVKISDIRTLAEGEEDGEVVGFKNRGYCVAPGSILSTSAGDLPYLLMTNPPAPHEAPDGLIEEIKLKEIEATYSGETGTSDKADVAKLVAELDMYGEFSTEPDWFRYMGAIKLALGDTEDGVEVALQMTTDDATAEAFWSRWKRLAAVDDGGSKCRIGSMIHRYKELTGKPFHVRKSVSAMFEGVAQLAAEQSPPLAPDGPLPEHPNLTAHQAVALEDFYGYLPAHTYIFTPTGEMWPASSVNSRVSPVALPMREKPIPAASWLDKNRAVEQMTWAPGKPMVIADKLIADGGWFDRPGCKTFNLYRPPTIKPQAGDATQWIDHVKFVFDDDDARHIIKWFAHRVQHPDQKVNHALVFGGMQGVGKDTLIEPVKQAVGPWNFAEVSPQQMLGRFNPFVKSVILRVSEARDLGDTDRFGFYEHTKAYTAAPPDVLRVDEKHMREHAVLNVCGVIITTNNKDSLHLPADDRRHFVAWSARKKEDFAPHYWTAIYRWFANGGIEIVAHHLPRWISAASIRKCLHQRHPRFGKSWTRRARRKMPKWQTRSTGSAHRLRSLLAPSSREQRRTSQTICATAGTGARYPIDSTNADTSRCAIRRQRMAYGSLRASVKQSMRSESFLCVISLRRQND
jgi:Bifunctional DNA primase/polymerase, N-terminal/Family of unknown function (DUF5906)